MKKLAILIMFCMLLSRAIAVECGNVPTSGCYINKDTTFSTGTYSINLGVVINKSNVVLDCNNSWLYGPTLNFGIRVQDKTGVTIKNCRLTHYNYGIYLRNSSYSTVTNNELDDNSAYGLYLRDSNNDYIIDNTLLRNDNGIYLQGSDNNIVHNNHLSENQISCIKADSSFNNEISSNEIIDNGNAYGIWVKGSNENVLKNNAVKGSMYGIFLQSSNNSKINNNMVRDNTNTNKRGVYLKDSNNNDLKGNTVTNNFHGIFLDLSSATNTIEYNNIYDNDDDGYSYDLYNNQADNVAAKYNWWGTINSSVIDSNIYDDDEDITKGVVDYSFWLTGFYNKTNKTIIELNNGWNLISVPLSADINSLPTILDSIGGKYDKIIAYDSEETKWKSYKAGRMDSLNSFKKIDEKMGLWINMLDSASLEINGEEAEPIIFDLKQGWNLIGYPSLNENNVSYVFGDVMDEVHSVFMYDAFSLKWRDYNPNRGSNLLDIIKPGFGYWVKANKDAKWMFADGKFIDYSENKIFSRELNAGWSLVSIPLVLDDKTLPNALSSIEGNYSKVAAYNGSDAGNEWKIFDPNDLTHSNLDSIDEKMGFWLKMINADTLVVEGFELDPTINFSLKQGYNLIGYPGLEEKGIGFVFNGINDSSLNALTYENNEWKSYNPLKAELNTLNKLKPGYGYVVLVNKDVNLNFG